MTNNETIFWCICSGLGLLFLSYRIRKTRRNVRKKQKQERDLTLATQQRALLHENYEAYNKQYILLESMNHASKEQLDEIKNMLFAYIKADNLKDKGAYLCFVKRYFEDIEFHQKQKKQHSQSVSVQQGNPQELVTT